MINTLENTLKDLKKLNSAERTLCLLNKYPLDSKDYYLVFQIIPQFSWNKKDRKILMEYYLNKIPFSSEKPYLSFIKISLLSEFLKVIEKIIDSKEIIDQSLLHYHLNRIFQFEISNKEYEKNKQDIKRILQKVDCY